MIRILLAILLILSSVTAEARGFGRGFGSRSGIVQAAAAVNRTYLADCSESTVQAAINAATDGDILICPIGAWTWDNVDIVNHNVTLQGAGAGNTVITLSSPGAIEATASNTGAFRITRFEFESDANFGTENGYGMLRVYGGTGWRIDHNVFKIYSDNESYDGGNAIYTFNDIGGLIDNNYFTKGGGSGCMHASVYIEGDRGSAWALASQIGSPTHTVFIENNTFDNPEACPAHNAHAFYGQAGGIGVLRHNEIREMNLDSHGFCAQHATREFEWSDNTWVSNTDAGDIDNIIHVRGGTGVVYNNDWSVESPNKVYWFQDYRVESPGSCGYTGTINVPGYGTVAGNTACATTEGYPCAEQIGRGQNQTDDPLYIWNNTGSATITNGSPTYIQANRDYYLNQGAKPGYTAYTYPHPLRAADNEAPTAPINLIATPVSTTEIDLSGYQASDDSGVIQYRFERCTGAACTDFVQVFATSLPAWNDTTLSEATTYRYRMRAADPYQNLSAYSNIINATTLTNDTEDPTDPNSLVATATSPTQINLAWTASTDNIGVDHYNIERCTGSGCSSWAALTTSATNSYSNTGLTASTTYNYRVQAEDAAGNTSGYSNASEDTTDAATGVYYSGSVINAASGSSAAVQSAINSAASLDIVRLPSSCSATWSSGVSIPSTKGIKLDGNGCTITGKITVSMNATYTTRVTGFTFSGGSDSGFDSKYLEISGSNSNAPFRVDNNTFNSNTTDVMIDVNGLVMGLIDHNSFSVPGGSGEMIHNYGCQSGCTSGWSLDVVPGSADAVYVEDNDFENSSPLLSGGTYYAQASAAMQNYYGARAVFRYNTMTMTHFDVHGTPGSVGGRWWEVYENEQICIANGNIANMMALRGGSGVAFNNFHTELGSCTGSYGSISLQEEDSGSYPELYQIGRGKNQALDPAYFWGNEGSVGVTQGGSLIQQNRDYYLTTKPGYSAYTYPHPLTTTTLETGE